ncbi:NAD(P)-bd_dom domain-containing protein, partial [Haematococcus lacustris]
MLLEDTRESQCLKIAAFCIAISHTTPDSRIPHKHNTIYYASLHIPPHCAIGYSGATGNTGRRVVQELRLAGFNVLAGTRDAKKAAGLGLGLDAGVTVVTADVLQGASQLEAALGDAQAVICATGYTGFNPQGFGRVDETGTKAL